VVGRTLGEAVMRRPIFMLVSGDGPRLDALRHDLSRRYEADYQVCVGSSAASALTMLAVQAGARAEVALVIADEHLADMPAPSPAPPGSPAASSETTRDSSAPAGTCTGWASSQPAGR
jgi:hypothetical protein